MLSLGIFVVIVQQKTRKNGYSALANQRLAKMLNTVFGVTGNGNTPTSISELLTARNSNYNFKW